MTSTHSLTIEFVARVTMMYVHAAVNFRAQNYWYCHCCTPEKGTGSFPEKMS